MQKAALCIGIITSVVIVFVLYGSARILLISQDRSFTSRCQSWLMYFYCYWCCHCAWLCCIRRWRIQW